MAGAGRLTTERTAATTALAVDLLARPGAHRLAVIGLGPVGRAHLRHARVVRRFAEIRVWSRTATDADLGGLGADVHLAASADEAAAGEMRLAAAEHGFTASAIRGDLPGLLAGTAPAPTGSRTVFFRSVGLGIEDAAVALAALPGAAAPPPG